MFSKKPLTFSRLLLSPAIHTVSIGQGGRSFSIHKMFWYFKKLSWVYPDLIIETGIAHWFTCPLPCSAFWTWWRPGSAESSRKVVGVDIVGPQIKALDEHPLRFKMELIEGSSIDSDIFSRCAAMPMASIGCWCPWIRTTRMSTCLLNWMPTPI